MSDAPKQPEPQDDDGFTWDLPDDPAWVKAYLVSIRGGRLECEAAVLAGKSQDTTERWRKARADNAARHTRARQEASARASERVIGILSEQAAKGSTWHLARYAALMCQSTWKTTHANLRDAEPDMSNQHLTGGQATQADGLHDLMKQLLTSPGAMDKAIELAQALKVGQADGETKGGNGGNGGNGGGALQE